MFQSWKQQFLQLTQRQLLLGLFGVYVVTILFSILYGVIGFYLYEIKNSAYLVNFVEYVLFYGLSYLLLLILITIISRLLWVGNSFVRIFCLVQLGVFLYSIPAWPFIFQLTGIVLCCGFPNP